MEYHRVMIGDGAGFRLRLVLMICLVRIH